ncbi:EamA-like transporter family protein [Oceanidesulfovibrio indonesiensis]|uniref:EamA-like transporter family protein n=1 Tax=Oceanidesulfovibrio indonesiensis TaxID=54767 RepID=A0A7M3MEN1_9BACT|nr:DMT family transporter [Oceanidesulfovibrio indonesiensis]TVM16698.1 EamA-like transporter family protein [Oceanidesulfovibrio indonesiensis]
MYWPYYLLALAAGICMPVQAGINARLGSHIGGPTSAAFVSFFVGTLALAVFLVLAKNGLNLREAAAQTSWWHWTGGVLGAFFVSSTIFLAPRLGATTMLATIVFAQMFASLIVDHYGLLDFPVKTASVSRIIGVALVVIGVILVRK